MSRLKDKHGRKRVDSIAYYVKTAHRKVEDKATYSKGTSKIPSGIFKKGSKIIYVIASVTHVSVRPN